MTYQTASAIFEGVNWIVLGYFVLLNSVYLITSLFAFGALRRYAMRMKSIDVQELIAGGLAPPITLIAPAYNEEATCVESVRSFLSLRYPDFDMVIVNDGSRDGTVARLVEAFQLREADRLPTAELPAKAVKQIYRSRLHPNLWVIDKENGGKADALNVGLNYCRTPLFCAMDADTLLERDALIRVVRPFLEDARTIATGGIIRIVNGCRVEGGLVKEVRLPKNYLAQVQVLEYLRAFLSGRMGWDAMGAMLIISGAFGLFRRSVVVAAGGYSTKTVGEDMELVVRLHRYCLEKNMPYRVTFVPDPVAWTECPTTLKVLGRQRDRWQRGLIEALSTHRRMLFNPRYGRIGLLAFPYFYFLEMMGPVIELCGYITFFTLLWLGQYSLLSVMAFLAVAIVLGVALSIAAVGLEELSFRRYPRFQDLLKLFGLAILENVGYRQLSTYWRVKGIFSSLRGVKGWGAMERKGFSAAKG